ncbi:MAG TPA: uracil-DNA glycosylase family protein, partial [Acidimicrobiales bacterium]|nr:uracil-DNA glycosylase family protein [Acidimicrobiales bacterium]
YAAPADEWRARRGPSDLDVAVALGRRAAGAGGGPVADLGCGPGWHTAALRAPGAVRPIALDAVTEMLDLVADAAPDALRVRADLGALPFRRGALGGAWAAKSYVHLPRTEVPLALADLHRSLAVGAPARLLVFAGDDEHAAFAGDDFPGRRFSHWPIDLLRHVLVGAGFDVESLVAGAGGRDDHIAVELTRARTLPDTVGPGTRLLVCGLNPSLYAADHGVGFARPGNRFWPAALAAGLVGRDRDPWDALRRHGIGMTDLVKRATPRADALTADEYAAGVARLDALCAWLRPGAVCLVGLAGWRAAVDRRAVAGIQDRALGGRPVYVMPSTSGLNAHARLDDLVAHLRAAVALADHA